jgi:His/Glu/Gln/Arg/opine family amino acid ABC transporter permease subunit
MSKNKNVPHAPMPEPGTFAFLRDVRFIRAAVQIVFAVVVVFALTAMWVSVLNTLSANNLLPTFDYLERRGGIPIGDAPEWYSTESVYRDAFLVGIINTLRVVAAGLVVATIMGVLLGIFLLSRNFLIRTISQVYVEILRNTPLLVQLIFWYFVVMLGLPENDITLPNESVLVFPLRYIPHLLTIIGVWIIAVRIGTLPRRLVTGAVAGALLLEVVFRFAGESYLVIILLALLGAALIVLPRYTRSIPEGWDGFVIGIGILLLAQFAGHLILDGLAAAGILENARFIYSEVSPLIYIARQGFVFPEITLTVNFIPFGIVLALGIILAVAAFMGIGSYNDRTGHTLPNFWIALAIFAAFFLGGWLIARAQPIPTEVTANGVLVPLEQARTENLLESDELARYNSDPLLIRAPLRNRFKRVEVGSLLSTNYMALFIGLVVYTSAFIGEIVRAGIQAVPYGQIEAARALGLSTSQTLQMIILPQALRVIIPPLGNQYLNLAKNSSLAEVVAFTDTYQISKTIMNQSGQSITGFFLLLLVYLTMSLIISFVMNIVNGRFQLVTR